MNVQIKNCVLPMKSDSIERASKYAFEVIERTHKLMEDVDWDMRKIYHSQPTDVYRTCVNVCSPVESSVSRNQPLLYKKSIESEQRFIEQTKEMAAFEYDKFVAKMESKIGNDIVSAEIKGNHVFDYSILTIKRTNGDIEFWKTRMILNVSKHGKLFNQFPTRKVKNA